eukprot:31135-Pelagococcus_subviridis.AAC.36
MPNRSGCNTPLPSTKTHCGASGRGHRRSSARYGGSSRSASRPGTYSAAGANGSKSRRTVSSDGKDRTARHATATASSVSVAG